MDDFSQGRYSLLIIFISFLFVIGSLLAVIAETSTEETPIPTATEIFTATLAPSPTTPATSVPPTATPSATPQSTPTDTAIPLPSDTMGPPSLGQCDPPQDWSIHFIQPGQTLDDIAAAYGTTTDLLVEGNCLTSPDVLPGYIIFVPPFTPTITGTAASGCSAPTGWSSYTVKSGDTLYSISRTFQTTVKDLQEANCMGSSTTIISGMRLWVPKNATITPTKTSSLPGHSRPGRTVLVASPCI